MKKILLICLCLLVGLQSWGLDSLSWYSFLNSMIKYESTQNVTSVEEIIENLKEYTNGLTAKDLDTKSLKKVREQFEPVLPGNEKILFVSYIPNVITMWYKNMDIVVTDKKLYVAQDASDPIFIPIEYFLNSTYQEGYIHNIPLNAIEKLNLINYFVQTGNDGSDFFEIINDQFSFRIPLTKFNAKDETYYKKIVDTLRNAADFLVQAKKQELDRQEEFWIEFQKIPESEQLSFLDNNFDNSNWRCHYAKAKMDYKNGDKNAALEEWEKANALLLPPWADPRTYEIINLALDIEEYTLARAIALTSDTSAQQKHRQNTESAFIKHFFDLPAQERKFIVPVDNQITAIFTKLVPLNIHKMPKGIKSATGHFEVGQIYVAHPYHKEKYFPLEQYKWNLLREQLFEFCEIMGYLGATKCSASTVSYHTHDGKTITINNTETSAGIQVKLKKAIGAGIKGDVDYSLTQEEQLLSYLQESNKFLVESHSVYNPHQIDKRSWTWYPHKDDWQELVKGITNNRNKKNFMETISTRDLKYVQNTVINQIKNSLEAYGEIGMIPVGVSLDETNTKQTSYEALEDEYIEMDVNVCFSNEDCNIN